MTQRDLMLTKLREADGRIVPLRELEEVVFAGCIRWPHFPREQLATLASALRKRGHHVELVSGLGYRLIEGDKR